MIPHEGYYHCDLKNIYIVNYATERNELWVCDEKNIEWKTFFYDVSYFF